jgi:hypothetical protein
VTETPVLPVAEKKVRRPRKVKEAMPTLAETPAVESVETPETETDSE